MLKLNPALAITIWHILFLFLVMFYRSSEISGIFLKFCGKNREFLVPCPHHSLERFFLIPSLSLDRRAKNEDFLNYKSILLPPFDHKLPSFPFFAGPYFCRSKIPLSEWVKYDDGFCMESVYIFCHLLCLNYFFGKIPPYYVFNCNFGPLQNKIINFLSIEC